MSEEVNEIDMMDKVDQNPNVHANSTPQEEAVLRAEYGEPNEDGFYGVRLEAEEDS